MIIGVLRIGKYIYISRCIYFLRKYLFRSNNIRILAICVAYRSVCGRGRRADDLQGFITLEEFMLLQQEEDYRQSSVNRSMSPRVTLLTNDHVHIQHRNFNDNAACNCEQTRQLSNASSNDDIGGTYGRISDENNSTVYGHLRHANTHLSRQLTGDIASRSDSKGDCVNDKSCGKCKTIAHSKKAWDSSCAQKRKAQEQLSSQQTKNGDTMYWRNAMNPSRQDFQGHSRGYEHNTYSQSSNHENYKTHDYVSSRDVSNLMEDFKAVPKRLIRNDGKFQRFDEIVMLTDR